MGPSEPVLSLSFWLPSSPMLAEALSPQTLFSPSCYVSWVFCLCQGSSPSPGNYFRLVSWFLTGGGWGNHYGKNEGTENRNRRLHF